MSNKILKVAISVPLSHTFDYLPAKAGTEALAGSRVLVPFGRKQQVGVGEEMSRPARLFPSPKQWLTSFRPGTMPSPRFWALPWCCTSRVR